MRALYEFGKTRRLSFVSHLDLQRFMQMALRRTDLPVAYSLGFNPHPVLSFASALAMGWTSDCEIMDIKFSEPVTEEFALSQMKKALPPDLPLKRVRLVDDRHPALTAKLERAQYRVTLDADEGEGVLRAIPWFLAETEVIALRKTKSGEKPTDIRPWCYFVNGERTEVGYAFDAQLKLTEPATLKPDLLFRVLARRAEEKDELASLRIHRTRLMALNQAGEPVDLFTWSAEQ